MNNFAFIQTGRGVTLFFGAKPVPVDQTHLYYGEIIEELKKGDGNIDVERVKELSNVPEAIKGKLYGDVTVTDGDIYYRNKAVHNTLTAKMINMIREGWDIGIWANFLNNVMKNPSEVAINELYLFLEKAQMPITSDGYFLAFKKVNEDYTSIHDGKTDNSIGSKPSMPRENVDADRNRTCSQGLHFCAHDYLSNFGSTTNSRVVIVKINPADVVAIPSDYSNAKGRAWTYEVVGEIENPGTGPRDKSFDRAVDDRWDAPEEDTKSSGSEAIMPLKRNSDGTLSEEVLFGDIYTADEILAKVNEVGSIRGAGRALGIAKSTFGDWVKKAKEVVENRVETVDEQNLDGEDLVPETLVPDKLVKILAIYFDPDYDFKPETKFVDDLDADSLDLVELVMVLEEEYGIEIDDERAERLFTVADIVNYLKELGVE